MYASDVWYPSKFESKALARVQKTATKWIGSSWDDYKTRLTQLNILPISMYMQLHDLLFLLSVINGNYNINSLTIINFKSTQTRKSKEFEVRKHKLRKCEKNFLTREKRLYNIVKKKDWQTTDKEASEANVHDNLSSMNLTAAKLVLDDIRKG